MNDIITFDTQQLVADSNKEVFEPYKLVGEEDPILKQISEKFDFKNDDAKEIAGRLTETIKVHRALGLAAPQCGISKRVIVIGAEGEYTVMFNPEITEKSKETVVFNEGCLSFPFMLLSIVRPKEIFVKFQDVEGEEKSFTLHGISSRIVQHECDHLNGITFDMVAKPLSLKMGLKKREKQIKNFAKELVNQKRYAKQKSS